MAIVELEPGLRQITAPNPSPMTAEGTNTYLIGTREIAVIDPGPAISAHLDAILGALTPVQQITHILVTHSHLDHSPLATELSRRTGAPIFGAGPSDWGRSDTMQRLAEEGEIGGGEGVDIDFMPHHLVKNGDIQYGDNWQIEAVHSPGHMANHVSFVWNGALFSGDVVMGWSTSLISPPDGDLTQFRNTLSQFLDRTDRVFYPGHGAPILQPRTRCEDLLQHRAMREEQILKALPGEGATAAELTAQIYSDIPSTLHRVASRNVLAHLIDLYERNEVRPIGTLSASGCFQRI